MNIVRGEIIVSSMAHIAGENSLQKGIRPIIPVSNGKCNRNSPIITAIVGTKEISKYRPHQGTHIILDESVGLREPTLFMCEQLQSIPINTLMFKVGQVPADKIHIINKCLSIQLELFNEEYVKYLIDDIIKIDMWIAKKVASQDEYRTRNRRYKEIETYCNDYGYDFNYFMDKYYNQRGAMCG